MESSRNTTYNREDTVKFNLTRVCLKHTEDERSIQKPGKGNKGNRASTTSRRFTAVALHVSVVMAAQEPGKLRVEGQGWSQTPSMSPRTAGEQSRLAGSPGRRSAALRCVLCTTGEVGSFSWSPWSARVSQNRTAAEKRPRCSRALRAGWGEGPVPARAHGATPAQRTDPQTDGPLGAPDPASPPRLSLLDLRKQLAVVLLFVNPVVFLLV
jgi:hypothetical protein